MANPYIDSNSTYFAFEERSDANGKRWLKAMAHASLTALTGYLVYPSPYGYKTGAPFDTGQTQGSAASLAKFYVGFPKAAVESGVIGWLQVEGYASSVIISSTTGSLGAWCRWKDESFVNPDKTSTSGTISDFAIFIDTVSKTTTHNLVLLGNRTAGMT